MGKFIFTWGASPYFAYQNGWTEVIAPDRSMAVKAFEIFHPKRPGSRYVNCAMIFSEREWECTQMAVTGENFGRGCWERITVEIEKIDDTYAPETLKHIETGEKITYRCEYLDG